MKSIKISLFVLLCACVLGGAYAFGSKDAKADSSVVSSVTVELFAYSGGDETDPQNYWKVEEFPGNCGLGQQICVIRAMDDGNGHPIITSELETRILNRDVSEDDVFVKL